MKRVTSAITSEGGSLADEWPSVINNEEDWGFGVISNEFTGV